VNLVGDLERLFATSLYPLRIPIAIGLILAAIGFAIVARRRGWPSLARRYPRRTAAVAVVALAIGLPVSWYLASPLFIRTTLVEPGPVAGAGPDVTPLPTGPAAAPSEVTGPTARSGGPTSEATSEPSPAVPLVIGAGAFKGADEFHFGEGMASIIETKPGVYVLRFEEFSVRNGPDLYVYLSPDPSGYVDGSFEVGTLKATDGAFGYPLPDGIDPTEFESAVIWCKQFAVLFAVAPLTRPSAESQVYATSGEARTIPLANAAEASVART
jgi:hypothetical protein